MRNGGRAFGRCARCGADLVEIEGSWRTAPKGTRIVWKTSGASAATPPEAEPPQREARGDRREGGDRRKTKGPLPAWLGGRDRRSGERDRRRAFGRRFRAE